MLVDFKSVAATISRLAVVEMTSLTVLPKLMVVTMGTT